jgi:hypothetical protein
MSTRFLITAMAMLALAAACGPCRNLN